MKKLLIIALGLGAISTGLQAMEPADSPYKGSPYNDKVLTKPLALYDSVAAKNLTAQSVTVDASVMLKDSTVKELNASSLIGNRLNVDKLNVTGATNLVGSVISDDAYIGDEFTCKDTVFKKGLTVKAKKIDLVGCTLKSLTVKYPGDEIVAVTEKTGSTRGGNVSMQVSLKEVPKKVVPQVRLKRSTIKGAIVFEGGDGELIVADGSHVDEKNVAGAVIKMEK